MSSSEAHSIDAELAEAIPRLIRASVLVIGDAMLDRYVYGNVARISPEAPVPVLTVDREVALPGGAGNVVRNLTALGAAVAFVSVLGDDQAGSDLTGLWSPGCSCRAAAAPRSRPASSQAANSCCARTRK
jgi:D-beta-D-heptose 7-phosphate kinase/D-beta-D-heptose 1-phosphate adenosyltransferase